MERIQLVKRIYGVQSYKAVINTQFSQLFNGSQTSDLTIEQFFEKYRDLLFSIPKEGDDQSHRYLLKSSAEMLGVNIDDEDNNLRSLLEEIEALRKELLSNNRFINDLLKNNVTGSASDVISNTLSDLNIDL